MVVPLAYDILSVQGCREWKTHRTVAIEQLDITTIQTDAIAGPSHPRVDIQPVDQFQGVDAKLREIEQDADAMRRDFDSLDIPRPAYSPQIEPLFRPITYQDRAAAEDSDGQFDDGAPLFLPPPPSPAHPGVSGRAEAERDRARMKLQLAQKARVSGQRGPGNEHRGGPMRATTGDRVEWTRVADALRDVEY
jgi:hypothetical protein